MRTDGETIFDERKSGQWTEAPLERSHANRKRAKKRLKEPGICRVQTNAREENTLRMNLDSMKISRKILRNSATEDNNKETNV